MEDLLELQEKHNKEFQREKMERLLTSEGRKNFIKEKLGGFVNKIIKQKNYQIVFGIIIGYILLTGIWYVFINLFTINTIFVILFCLLIVYWKYLIKVKDYIGYKLYKLCLHIDHFGYLIDYKIFRLKIYLRGITRKKK